MAIDRQLLKRVLEHYRHRLDEFLEDEKIKPLASGHLSRHITDLRQNVDEALTSLASLKDDTEAATRNWVQTHANILGPAVSQYEKDAKQLLAEARQKLSGPNLHELEIELARIAAEIATLLNL